ncbi:MAG: hypothetical protein QGH32_09385, partial [Alphaproteobacteria bacterium]|nr:hypothetical protein [Alphaproteobacteria bacterium]
GYVIQYGSDMIGKGRILVRANMDRLYRSARRIGDGEDMRTMPPRAEPHSEDSGQDGGPKFNVGN